MQSPVRALPTLEEVEMSINILSDFPQGERRVVGLNNDIVVKYGKNIDLNKAKSISFVAQNTAIPVPKILRTYTHQSKNYIFMTGANGIPLSSCRYSLSPTDYDTIAEEMKECTHELRAL